MVPLQADPRLVELLGPKEAEAGEAERFFRIRVEAFDWNCPQFITPRFTQAELEGRLRPLQERIAELETQIQRLQSPLS